MPQKGGKREGAGRKKAPHTIASEAARKLVIERVLANLEPLLTAQIEAAKGIYVEKETESGTVIVFREKPDVGAGKYLIDQTIGKAKESVAVQITDKTLEDLLDEDELEVEEETTPTSASPDDTTPQDESGADRGAPENQE
jgi:hypothetical protein